MTWADGLLVIFACSALLIVLGIAMTFVIEKYYQWRAERTEMKRIEREVIELWFGDEK